MSDSYDQRYFRSADGRPIRVKVVYDEDAESPRGEANGSLLFTWHHNYHSPDDHELIPTELRGAVNEWAVVGGVDVYRISRGARMFHPDEILFVGGLAYAGSEGRLGLNEHPGRYARYEGIAVVTRDGWRQMMGDSPTTGWVAGTGEIVTPAEMARQEVERYAAWAVGEVYGFVVEYADTDEHIDSCWGFIGESVYAMQVGVENLPEGASEITEAEFDELLAVAH
jgi:hypothetical protein